MKDLIAKLTVGLQDADTKKALESIGITTDFIKKVPVIEKPETLDDALTNFDFKGEFDRRISKAVSTNEATLKEKFDFVAKDKKDDKKKDEKDDKKDDTSDPVLAALAAMQKKLDALEKEKSEQQVQTKKEKALALLKSKNIPDVYVHTIDLEKDLEEQLKAVEEVYATDTAGLTRPPGIRLPNPNNPPKGKLNAETVEKFKKIF